MSRVYIQPSWVGAAEGWSGDSPDNRKCSSTELYLPDGKANTKAFADDEPKAKAKPKSSIMDKIDLANRHLNRLEIMSAELEHDFDSGSITLEEYSRGRRIMDERLDKAFQRVAKQNGWDKEEQQEATTAYAWTESKASVGTAYAEKDSIFLSLPVDNSFRRAYTWLQKAKNLFKG